MTGIHCEEHQLLFQCQHIGTPHALLSACGIGNDASLSWAIQGCGGMSDRTEAEAAVDAVFGDLTILRRCTHRIHRFSPGVEGCELLEDGNRCASLGYWGLIASGGVDPSTAPVSLLHAACRIRRWDAVKSIVADYGVEVNARDGDGWTALHAAMAHGEECLIRDLLSLGAEDVATDDGVHASALRPALWARATGDEVAMAADVWVRPRIVQRAVSQLVGMLKKRNASTELLCHRVCAVGPAVVQGRDTEKRRIRGWTATWTVLAAAARTGRSSLGRLCVELGAEVDKVIDRRGVTPLYVACQSGHVDCAHLLLERGASDDIPAVGVGPLWVACAMGDADRAQALLHRGATVDKASRFGGVTPLFIACQNGHLDCVRLLLHRGADGDRATDSGVTPLFIACERGHLDCAQLLLNTQTKTQKREKIRLSRRLPPPE